MSVDRFLTPDELFALTGCVRPSAQKKILDEMKIRYHERDGALLVTWHFVNHPYSASPASSEAAPNFSALKRAS